MPRRRLIVPALYAAASVVWAGTGRAPSLNVRLTTPLTSYDSKAGAEFRAVVISPYRLDGEIVMPPGTVVLGAVRRTRGVGLGIVRERASMELDFHEYELPDGRRFPFRATLRGLDNARETVNEAGRIQGILAANGPQSLVGGIWHRPRFGLLARSFIGLTGAGGRIFSSYSMGPPGAAILFAIRCAIFRLPEPEIRLPAGTEMKLSVIAFPADAPSFAPLGAGTVPGELGEWLATQPMKLSGRDGVGASDIINVAFVGSREQLVNAFRSAGWFEAERLTPRSFSRAYKAYTTQTGYAALPISKLAYRGAQPDAVFQKSFNTMRKRDHIRIWRAEADGGREVWLGAATHDIGVKFRSAFTLTHRIHPRIDAERTKVIDDLEFAGCVEPAAWLDRPGAAVIEAGGDEVFTDGRLAALLLRSRCTGAVDSFSPTLPSPPNSRAARVVRRMVLEGRQYAIRGNAYYWAYRAVAFNRARRQQPAGVEE